MSRLRDWRSFHPGVLLIDMRRSTQKGAKLLPPYKTPIGQVGSLICFDVSELLVHPRSLLLLNSGTSRGNLF